MSWNITVEGGKTVRLPTKGKYCDRDIVVTAEAGSGGGGDDLAKAIVEGTITEFISDVSIVKNGTFTGRTQLTTVVLPFATKLYEDAFYGCRALISADFSNLTQIDADVFRYCNSLTRLILRKSDAVCSLSVNVFVSTPIASGTGYIYVPAALIEEYKVATRWSTHAAQFRALEDYTVDGTITGALDESKI